MEVIAKGLVGQDVVLTIATKMGTFKKTGKIVHVLDGIIRLKGPSGMESPVPLKDQWMNVTGIEYIIPEDEIIGTA